MKNEETQQVTVKSSLGEKIALTASGAVISTISSTTGRVLGNVLTDEVKDKLVEYDIIKDHSQKENEHVESMVEEQATGEDHTGVNNMEVNDVYVDGPGAMPPTVPIAVVDDSLSFANAFAEARELVGAGGVFEWHGRAFHTYYEAEWNQMSVQERAEFQASIDYYEVLSDEDAAQRYTEIAQNNLNHVGEITGGDIDEEDIEVHLLDIGTTDINDDGIAENACIVDIAGNEVVIVDVDNDGIADVAIHDANENGLIDDGEAMDISDEGLIMPDESDLEDQGLAYVDDDAPDYMNDANVGLFEA